MDELMGERIDGWLGLNSSTVSAKEKHHRQRSRIGLWLLIS